MVHYIYIGISTEMSLHRALGSPRAPHPGGRSSCSSSHSSCCSRRSRAARSAVSRCTAARRCRFACRVASSSSSSETPGAPTSRRNRQQKSCSESPSILEKWVLKNDRNTFLRILTNSILLVCRFFFPFGYHGPLGRPSPPPTLRRCHPTGGQVGCHRTRLPPVVTGKTAPEAEFDS